MPYFVIVYDKPHGNLMRCEEYADDERDQALAARVNLEEIVATVPDIEVVMLGAPSLGALKRTHARYFYTPAELVAQMREML
jgi:hypothetical protein